MRGDVWGGLARLAVLGIALALAGCKTVENSLTANDISSMKLTAVTVSYAPDATVQWEDGIRAYAAAKSAVVGMTKTLAKEWGPLKVCCNAVAFGWIETRLTAALEEAHTLDVGGETVTLGLTGDMRAAAAALTPLGRAGTPEEAAGPVLFLCSPYSDFVNGQVVTVSGGQQSGMTD